MGSRNRHHQVRPSSWGSSDGLQPGDGVGNRRSFKEMRVPADDIGNRTDRSGRLELIRDDIGNSIDIAPTHSLNSSMVTADGRTRRRKEDLANNLRVGRYIMGGVNPIVAGLHSYVEASDDAESEAGSASEEGKAEEFDEGEGFGGRNKKRRRKRRDGRNMRENLGPDDSADRRLRRLFDFDEDDRIEYVLTSDPEQKREAAESTVRTILERASCSANVQAQIIKNEQRLCVLVTILEKEAANIQVMFSRGSIELTALNFIVNKIVNRYPNDRIRLVVLPKADEEEYIHNFKALENDASTEEAPAMDKTS